MTLSVVLCAKIKKSYSYIFKTTRARALLGLALTAVDFSRMHYNAIWLTSEFFSYSESVKAFILQHGIDRLDPYGIAFSLLGIHILLELFNYSHSILTCVDSLSWYAWWISFTVCFYRYPRTYWSDDRYCFWTWWYNYFPNLVNLIWFMAFKNKSRIIVVLRVKSTSIKNHECMSLYFMNSSFNRKISSE